jgi:hypothetical protein
VAHRLGVQPVRRVFGNLDAGRRVFAPDPIDQAGGRQELALGVLADQVDLGPALPGRVALRAAP